ncbi:hypothetical protein CcI156_04420 [Frankia sp. CcI156]|uniref:Uncharacterized protein n=1 Tax=Frankia casuarinae (strain DSM 45818 / CECT 9043 / HFP020203 / CcI3) TaxID=106370 RepID=Q2JCC8_FRACC|nr:MULTISPECIES: hypothetical protein [Frankia]ABD11064.1 hypothetical protein Francci3_1688 [Frankia casuarinae]ETA00922.1 hypothetical protein CcI6DRAFT_03609 [Frankia sp. CcI6]EYT89644.1 hypothetical protein ThrDRAFT_04739 [Frankia casuarinae]OAA19764.1 hypothetical protein AAY23_110218 [Frankia casuarinae]OFB45338.1 hypothetical protein Manayef4_06555 [Frankia sp. CgIM4]
MPVSDPDRDRGAVVPAGQLATVWPCPPDSPARPPAGWLQSAVEQLVATHTRPGDPVLLLTPPAPDGFAAGRRETQADRLADAGGAVARLGRHVQVRPAPATPGPWTSGSGPGPATSGEGPDDDRRSLVVTVVEPTRTGWLHGVPWARLVTSGGLLAVISRSDSIAGWLIEPTAELTAATGRHGLALLDRFVLLEVPLDELDQPPTPLPRATVARRVHSDLLLFAPVLPAGPQERQ